MKKALIAIGLLLLIAGCTQEAVSLDELGDLPDLSTNGMSELGELPSVNQTVDIGGGAINSNPFPDQPSIE